MKLTRETRHISTNTLNQDHRLHIKLISIFGSITPHCQTLSNFFPSTLSKIYIKRPLAKPFYEFCPQTTHAIQTEFPSLNKRESKTHQRGTKEDSKEPESLHSEEEGDLLSLLQIGIRNIYLPRRIPSCEVGPKLTLPLRSLPSKESHLKRCTQSLNTSTRKQKRIGHGDNRFVWRGGYLREIRAD